MAKTKTPSAPGAERYLITICLNEPTVVVELANLIKPEDFNNTLYRYVYQICGNLVEEDMVPEPMTIYNHLDKLGVAEASHLKELVLLSKASYDTSNIKEYVDEVRSCSAKRLLLKATEDCSEEILGMKDYPTPDELVEKCQNKILEVSSKLSNAIDVYKLGDNAEEILAERVANPVKIPGLPTGFSTLDEEIQGLQGGRLYVLAARYKTGKSVFLMNVAAHVAINCGIPVLIIDTENPSPQIEDRFLSLLSGVEQLEISNGMYVTTPGAEEKVKTATQILVDSHIYHQYMPNFTFDSCMSLIKRYHIQKSIGLVIFDYIKSPDDTAFQSLKEYQSLGNLTTSLKNKIAGALDVPVLTACQLGRTADGQVVFNDSDIADSDRIGRYANCLLMLREKTDNEKAEFGSNKRYGNMTLTVHVNRDGPAKQFAHDIYFDKPVMSMKEVRARKI